MKKALLLSCFLFVSLTIYSQDTYHSNLQNFFQTEYSLPQGEWLFYDNEEAILSDVGTYGGTYSIQESVGTDFSKLARAVISRAGANAWDSGWSLNNQGAIAKEDKVLIIFSVRSVGGKGEVNVFAENAATYAKETFLTINVAEEWTQYFVPFTTTQSYSLGSATFGFHLAAQVQNIEIGGFTAINFGKDVDLSGLPNKINNDKYDGFAADAPWRATAAERIENFRKSDISILVKTPNGAAVANARVEVKMLRHEYAFGTAVKANLFAKNNAHNNTYENKILNLDGKGHGFNWVVFENSLKWPGWEQNWIVSQPELANAVQWLRTRNIEIRGHTLVWPGADNLPNDINENSTDLAYIINRIDEHLEEVLNYPEIKGEISEWDVLNEITTNRSLENYFKGKEGYVTGREVLADVFKKVRIIDPNTGLWLNDYITLSQNAKPGNGNYDNYKLFIKELIDADVDLEGLGFQSHIGGFPNGIPSVLETLDDFYNEFGLKAKVTEFDLPSFVEEEVAAQYLRDFMIATFSHESMNGFLFWSFWDGATYMNEGANLFRNDWSQTPAGDAFIDLVFNEWWTNEVLIASEEGQIKSNVFKGLHEISYESDGEIVRDTVNITEDTNIEIIASNISTDVKALDLDKIIANIYPNPANNKLVIQKLSNQSVIVRLFDIAGKMVLEQKIDDNYITLSVENLKGMYIVEITDGRTTVSKKVSIQ